MNVSRFGCIHLRPRDGIVSKCSEPQIKTRKATPVGRGYWVSSFSPSSRAIDDPAKDAGCHQFFDRSQCISDRRVVVALGIPYLAECPCE
jgi:hypothetical protein